MPPSPLPAAGDGPPADGPIAGVDEVGRGPLAGPVVAAAVVLLARIPGIADSKALRPKVREALALEIRRSARFGIGAASVAEIGRLNVLGASLLAMRRAVARLPGPRPARVLVDGNRAPDLGGLPVLCVVGGDATVPEIGAASIVAKVLRDALMRRLDARHPGYGFARHAGYGTPEHLAALERLGPSPHHRRAFAPVRRLLEAGGAPAPPAASR